MTDEELETPERIGPYRVERAIARGGMAAVYEVQDPESRERYALKLLTQRGLARPRFDREYRALTRLDHPNIVRVYRFGFDEEDRPWLTMELLDGVAAQVHAKSCGRPGNPRRTAEVVRIVMHVADALDYLHRRSIVHRDLKSSNVMVLPDGRVKLLDFGTARMHGATEEITRKGEFVGTFAYASPEQLQGREVDPRADIYSLGVLFYRLLTGKRPFEADSPHALALLHIEQEPRPPQELAPGLARPLVELVLQMLAKAPELRPRSAKDVADRLREFAARSGRVDRPTMPLPPTLVGREAPLRDLRERLDDSPPGGMVVLSGPPGSGRRRLLEQLALDAHRKGRRVYRGEFPGGSALGPLYDLVQRATRSLPDLPGGGTEADRLSRAPRTAAPPPEAQAEMLDAVASAFIRRAQADGRGLVMHLLDLHKAPPLAVQAVRHLRAQAEEQDVSVIIFASCVPEADGQRSMMQRQFPDVERVELEPLRPREVGRLVGSMLGRTAPPPELARRIHDATGGLPGYVEEVVRAMAQEGLVHGEPSGEDSVSWVDRSSGRIAIPSSAREAVSLRLQALDPISRRIVAVLAVAGGTATAGMLVHGSDLPEELAEERLREMVADRILVLEDDEHYAFRLGLTAEILLSDLRATRRLVIQRRLATRLREARPSPLKVKLLLAAGEVDLALHDAVSWARSDIEGHDRAELLGVLQAVAARLGEVTEAPASLLARFHLYLAQALAERDPTDEQIDRHLDRAGALAAGWARKAEVYLARAQVARRRGDGPRERASITRARGLLDHVPDPLLHLRVNLAGAGRSMADGRYEDALVRYRDAQRGGEQGGDLAGAAKARSGAGLARYCLGELEAAERTLQGAAGAFERLGDGPGLWRAQVRLADVLREQARFSEAVSAALAAVDAVRRGAPPDLHARVLVHTIELLVEMFRLGEARELVAELRAIESAGAGPGLAARRSLVVGRVLVDSDEPLGALSLLEPAAADAERHELPVARARLLAWSGVAAARAGDLHHADDLTRRAVAMLRRERHLPALAEACRCRGIVRAEHEDPDRIYRPVVRWMDSQPARIARMSWLLARVDHAIARGDLRNALASLDRASRLLDDIGRRLSEADRASMRVHPWHRRIARHQGELAG
ncbi:MAG: protein kinase [Alphaproteobacteria bacterium]|nr:protein kinase [Alphaproteobacteria bacterium]